MDFSDLEHAHGDASDLVPLLDTLAAGDGRQCIDGWPQLLDRIIAPGRLFSASAPAIAAVIASLTPERGDASVALCMRLTTLLRRVRPGVLYARTLDDPGLLGDFGAAFAAGVPVFQRLRREGDVLQRVWATELLSWLPDPVPGLAAEELGRLDRETHPIGMMSAALAAAMDPSLASELTAKLREWLRGPEQLRRAAAMVWAMGLGDARSEAVPDEAVDILVGLVELDGWPDWDAVPGSVLRFHGDLASNLLQCCYSRADRTLPAVLRLVEVCSPDQLEGVLGIALKLVYQSAPYAGDPDPNTLTALQKHSLARLARIDRAWQRPLFVSPILSDLGLPLDPAALLAFVGAEANVADPELKVTAVNDDVLTLDTALSPHQVRKKLED